MVVSISLQSTEARCSCTLRCSVKAFCTALTTGFVEMCKVSKASKPPAFPWLMWSFNHDAFTRFFAVKKVWPSNMCVYTYIYIYTHLSFVYIIHGNPPAKVYLSLFCGRDTPFTHVYIYIYIHNIYTCFYVCSSEKRIVMSPWRVFWNDEVLHKRHWYLPGTNWWEAAFHVVQIYM